MSSQVKNYSPGYMEQAPSRDHDARPQGGLGVGWKLCSRSTARAECTCAGAAHKHLPSQELPPKYIEQDAKQGPSSQFAASGRGVGFITLFSSKGLRGLSVRAFCCEGFQNPVPLTQRDEAQLVEVKYRVSVSGRSVTQLHSTYSS